MSDRIAFDEILELTNDERMSHLARMIAIRKICVREIDKVTTATTTKRGPGRPPKAKDDGPETGNAFQNPDSPPPGPAAA